MEAQFNDVFGDYTPFVTLVFAPNMSFLHGNIRIGAVLKSGGERNHPLYLTAGIPFKSLAGGVRDAHAHVIIEVFLLS